MMQLNSNQIAEIIPHRYPFALVDRIVDGEVGKWAKGIKCVTVNEPFFQGHFPQYHVMPGVLIIEALAQVGAVTMLSMPENKGKIGLFGGIKNARFRRQVTPGDVLELECTILKLSLRPKPPWAANWPFRQSLPLPWPKICDCPSLRFLIK